MKKNIKIFAPLILSFAFLIAACGVQNRSQIDQSSTTSQLSENNSSEESNKSSEISSNNENESSNNSSNEHSSKEDSSSISSNESSSTINVTGISLNYETASLYVDKNMTLVVDFIPSDATNKNVIWSSSNNNVATVNNGTVTGVAAGTATITATSEDGGYSASCTFIVNEEEEDSEYIPDTTDSDIYVINESTLSNGVYDSNADEYTFAITKNYKQIYVNAADKTIIIELNNVTIENNENSPIYVETCDTIEISAKKGTVNYIKDTRDTYSEDIDGQGKGAIYVEDGDLKLKGTGTLNIDANYYNGIHGKDDVKIQKQTLNITAVNHAIRGNDSITITSGTIDISCGGDGLHTDNSDISSKGNQRGNATISGGTLNINSWGDAIDAAYNAVIEESDSAVPTIITAKTNKYSSYTGEIAATSESKFYLKMNSSTYSKGNYTYAAYINDAWYPATYKGTLSTNTGQNPGGWGGGNSTSYIYEIDKPSSATSFTLYRFSGNVSSYSTTSYNAVSDIKAFNSAYDMVTISISNNKINFSNWSNYSSSSTGSDISAKGIKANNEVYITGGTLDIKSYDDGIHANNDNSLENGSSPLGNININDGTITIYASDDAIHADYILNITGGKIDVTSSYEGLEGNLINISGGESYIYATDDGVNATSGNKTPVINVTGGLLDVTVPTSGDTDGVDSNGSYTQNGGTVIIKGPGNANGQTMGAAALDTDGTVSISNGTLAVFGGIEKTPSSSVTKTLCSSSTVSAGNHTISFNNGTSYSTTLKSSTGGCVVYSSLGSATLK